MLCCMEQQTKNVRRQLRAADATMLEQLIGGSTAKLIERAIDLRGRVVHEIGKKRRWIARLLFRPEDFFLRITQPFATRVGEQTIQRGAEMLHVEPD